jgi:hypothetical protein
VVSVSAIAAPGRQDSYNTHTLPYCTILGLSIWLFGWYRVSAGLAPGPTTPSWLPRQCHVCVDVNVDKELDANWTGAETFDFGANNNGAKRMIYFLKSYCQDVFVRIFRKKAKKKKSVTNTGIPFSK